MTTQELLAMSCLYLIAMVFVAYFTRATARRLMGALIGGAAVGAVMLKVIALCEAHGWWQVPFASTPYFVPLLFLALSISSTPIYLVTWRVARRYGWQGLAVAVGIVAVIGPPRDYAYAAAFPRWMVFSPGIAPILADSAAYIAIVIVGHAVMRLVSGPAADPSVWEPRARRLKREGLAAKPSDPYPGPSIPAVAHPRTVSVSVTEQESGIVNTHITAVEQTAAAQNTFIFARPTEFDSTTLIRAGYATKSVDVHHKSSNWGPMAGFVPCDPAFSKKCEGVPNPDEHEHQHDAATPTHLGLKPELLASHTKIVTTNEWRLVPNPGAKGMHDAWLAQNAPAQKKGLVAERLAKFQNGPEHKFCTDSAGVTAGNKGTLFCLILRNNLWMVYWVDKATGRLNPLRVFAYRLNDALNPVTGDYDLWMVAPHFKHFDDHVITRLQNDSHGSSAASGYTTRLLSTLNAMCGRATNPVFNHGAESQNYDFTQALDHNLAMFTPGGSSRMVRMNQMPGILADLREAGYLAVWNKRYGEADSRFAGKAGQGDLNNLRQELDTIYGELEEIRRTANPSAVAASAMQNKQMPAAMQTELKKMAQRFEVSRNYGQEQSRVYRFHRQLLDFLSRQLTALRVLRREEFGPAFLRYTAEFRQIHGDLQRAMVEATKGKGETNEAMLRQWLVDHQAQIKRLKEYVS